MSEVALVFNGPISAPATVRLRSAICAATNGGFPGQNGTRCRKLWLLISSGGGNIEDGFALYNLLRTLKCEVVTVNMGQIASIANVIFLAGDHRIACPESYFHFHDFEWPFPSPHTMSHNHLTETSQLLEMGRINKKALFKSRTTLTDADFETLKFLEDPMVKDASFAKENGIVQEICLPDLPPDTPVFNVEY